MSRPSITIIPPLLEKSLQNAFKVMMNANAKIGRMSMDASVASKFRIDCLSTITLNSSTLAGTLSLGFGSPAFLALLTAMLGEPYTEITPENSDAASELLNIVYANSRKEMNEAGFDFEPSIPTTVIGTALHLAKSNLAGQALFFEGESDFGPFLMTLSLKAKTA
ncbi:MAG: chemotaxis protein CheX [Bdellovibrionaceae bacterium]|nr:chemotaxis protein CheX [Pseudobdellovibrionaceae bacterium]